MLTLESNSPESPELEIEAGISVVHMFEENAVVIAGNDHVIISVLGRDFRVSAASFFQVNTAMAEKMVNHLAYQFANPSIQSCAGCLLRCGSVQRISSGKGCTCHWN